MTGHAMTADFLVDAADANGVAPAELFLVTQADYASWSSGRDAATRAWLEATGFKAERQQLALLPGPGGDVRGAVLGLGPLATLEALELWHVAGLPERLPAGTRWLLGGTELAADAATAVVLGWAYGSYRFEQYKSPATAKTATARPRLVAPAGADRELALRLAAATAMARDFVNTPAADMNPARLASEVAELGRRHGASIEHVSGEALQAGFPAIHAVGQASAVAPRLVELRWGDPAHPKVTLVGKGVCFDTGGLDIKPSAGMALMKKDMGGAACTLALARLVMETHLPVRLRVLIPAVENAISGSAYRPGDVIRTRKGLTVEIGNTDAEGRLVLCDAIAWADDERPDLLVDLATLTGAARVALGPDLPAVFGSKQETVDALLRHGRRVADPLWQMPLWSGYDDDIASKVADVNNASATTFAGSIIGALFLRRFVTQAPDWLHVDLYAWNPKERPGRPVGAEAQAVRALFALLSERYG
ncbi:MAG TPA: leucyl aminopeptidase family protein [Steroidobacteraceae bacterium]|nr:leucyl aminopeptidase family protein [Steroidobacteraceae bacterium]